MEAAESQVNAAEPVYDDAYWWLPWRCACGEYLRRVHKDSIFDGEISHTKWTCGAHHWEYRQVDWEKLKWYPLDQLPEEKP